MVLNNTTMAMFGELNPIIFYWKIKLPILFLLFFIWLVLLNNLYAFLLYKVYVIILLFIL